jgi:predicted PurR-regulated permease PerM
MTVERRVAIWAVGFVLFAWFLWALSGILLPFVVGIALAYVLDPAADRLERAGMGRSAVAALLIGLAFLAVAAALVLLVPVLEAQFVRLAARMPDYVAKLQVQAMQLLATVQAHLTQEDMGRLREAAGGLAGNALVWVGGLFRGVWSGGLAVANFLGLVLVTPVVAFYLLRDWDHMVARLDSWLPQDAAATVRAKLAEIDRVLAGFARGQALVCLILATYYGIGLTAIGIEFGLIVGIATGLVAFIPIVGGAVGFLVALGLAFAGPGGWLTVGLVVALFAVGNVLEGQLLSPYLVGRSVGLHPVWLIFALLAGGALLGFVGVLLAVPAAAAIGVLARYALAQYLQSPLYRTGRGPGG